MPFENLGVLSLDLLDRDQSSSRWVLMSRSMGNARAGGARLGSPRSPCDKLELDTRTGSDSQWQQHHDSSITEVVDDQEIPPLFAV